MYQAAPETERPVMTCRELLMEGIHVLRNISSPEIDSRCLFLAAAGLSEIDLFRYPEKTVPPSVVRRFRRYLRRRASGCPVAYIIGKKYFWKDEFCVGKGVLIPRPETEGIVEAVLHLRSPNTARIVDLGTGTGNIILSLAREMPNVDFFGIDRSQKALNYASINRRRLGLPDVRLFKGIWFRPLIKRGLGEFDFILSNPPYVSEEDWKSLERGVRFYEPRSALVPGITGLESLSYLVRFSPAFLRPGGFLIFEIGYGQKNKILPLFDDGWKTVTVENDLNDIPRILIAQKAATSSI